MKGKRYIIYTTDCEDLRETEYYEILLKYGAEPYIDDKYGETYDQMYIYINDLDSLDKLVEDVGKIVFDGGCIEIYDTYRE